MMAGPLWLHRRFGIEVRREQADSAYADLVRLTGHDPAAARQVAEFGASLSLATWNCRSVEVLKHFYQVGQTRCVHFSHSTGTMYLHRNLAQPQVGSYLLIELSGCYPCDHLLLTGT